MPRPSPRIWPRWVPVDPELAHAYRVNALRTAQRAHAPEDVVEVLAR